MLALDGELCPFIVATMLFLLDPFHPWKKMTVCGIKQNSNSRGLKLQCKKIIGLQEIKISTVMVVG